MQNRFKNQSKNEAEKYHENSLKNHPKSNPNGSWNFPDFPGNRPQGDPETNEPPKRHQEHPRDPSGPEPEVFFKFGSTG